MQVQKKQALQKKIHTMYTEFTNSQLMFIQLPNLRNRETTLFGFPIINLPRNNF